MRLLLDTHILIWWIDSPQRLPARVRLALEEVTNEIHASVVNLWEIQVKLQLGKLQLTVPLTQLIASQRRINALRVLPVEPAHIYELDNLPLIHRDPFDRLLIAQANVEGLTLVTVDPLCTAYPVSYLN
jgi:PIN domain nuclease of toxin-antitoxin system